MIDVIGALIVRGGKVLIAKRVSADKGKCKWEFPGGKRENGESPEECLKRELLEEFGVNTEIGDFFSENEYIYEDGCILLKVYFARLISDEITLNVHSEVKWVDLQNIREYSFLPADIPIVEKVQNLLEGDCNELLFCFSE